MMLRPHRSFVLGISLLSLALWGRAASAQVPAFAEVVGHEFGERVTQHHEMVRYLERLAEASDRVTVRDVGRSWEGRRFLMAIVTSPANHARLGQIQANAQRLSDPRTTSPESMMSVVGNHPLVMWFGGSIHGFELSGSEGALKLLEHLATRTDQETLNVLESTVVLIDPMLNPDGRDAFAHRNHENIGRVASADPADWSNSFTGWDALKYRTGHYFFDNNRDWFATTQPETRDRVQVWLDWRPQTIVDMHEMGSDDEFFFYPGAPPLSPYVPAFAVEWIERFAREYATSFDVAGVQYMTREAFDYFYPGYTDGFGSLQGAVGMLYEQGSSRGLRLERSDRTVRTLEDALEHQYTAAWTAVRYGASQRQELLREYYQSLAAALGERDGGVRRYLLPPGGDPGRRADLVNLLLRSGLEVGVTTAPVRVRSLTDRAGGAVDQVDFPAGTFVIDAGQPRARLVHTLLTHDTPMPQDFVAAARERVNRGESAQIYDISAWSLPLLFDVPAFGSTDSRSIPAAPVSGEVAPEGAGVAPDATYAFLLDGRNAGTVAALYRLVAGGFRVAMTTERSIIQGQGVPTGTGVVWADQGGRPVRDAVREAAERFGIVVRAVATGLADSGKSLGSSDVISIRRPEIALLAENPVQGYSFGWAWHALDRVYEIPTTVLRTGSVANTDLAEFDVLVIPAASSGALNRELGESAVDRMRQWVRDGGTLVTIGGATDFARDSNGLNVIALRAWHEQEDHEDSLRYAVPGAILRGQLERRYWLAAGYQEPEFPVLVEGNRVYLPPDGAPTAGRRSVGRLAADSTQLRMAGVLWPEAVARLTASVFLYEERVGRGRVIAFAEDPNYRGFWRGADRLFLNAVVVGPSAP